MEKTGGFAGFLKTSIGEEENSKGENRCFWLLCLVSIGGRDRTTYFCSEKMTGVKESGKKVEDSEYIVCKERR